VTHLPRACELGLMSCHICGMVSECSDDAAKASCPRCGSVVHRRKPESIARGWAFLVAGLIFYVLANVFPAMRSEAIGSLGDESTIVQGITQLWQSGDRAIATLIFLASVAMPCAKFLAIVFLLTTSQRKLRWAPRERTHLYRIIEMIGYWSMLDVLVVAMLTSLMQFGELANVQPGTGIFYFGMTVVLTMLSAMSFDPRLIWDNVRKTRAEH
jgi:paraquat-inducible protein A